MSEAHHSSMARTERNQVMERSPQMNASFVSTVLPQNLSGVSPKVSSLTLCYPAFGFVSCTREVTGSGMLLKVALLVNKSCHIGLRLTVKNV